MRCATKRSPIRHAARARAHAHNQRAKSLDKTHTCARHMTTDDDERRERVQSDRPEAKKEIGDERRDDKRRRRDGVVLRRNPSLFDNARQLERRRRSGRRVRRYDDFGRRRTHLTLECFQVVHNRRPPSPMNPDEPRRTPTKPMTKPRRTPTNERTLTNECAQLDSFSKQFSR